MITSLKMVWFELFLLLAQIHYDPTSWLLLLTKRATCPGGSSQSFGLLSGRGPCRPLGVLPPSGFLQSGTGKPGRLQR